MFTENTWGRWENAFPGFASIAQALLEPLRDAMQFKRISTPAPGLFDNPSQEVPWLTALGHDISYVDSILEPTILELDYHLCAEELLDIFQRDLAPRLGDDRTQSLLDCLASTLSEYSITEERYLIDRMTAEQIYQGTLSLGFSPPSDLLLVRTKLTVFHDVLRNVFKLSLVTLAGDLLSDPRYNCRLAIQRCQQGIILYGRHRLRNRILYICDHSK